jgi:putative transposase
LLTCSCSSPLRSDCAGEIYHALNRGNARNDIFFKQADFEAFERVISEGLEKHPVDLIAYQWMSNHWHMVLSPQKDKAMSSFLGWVTMTHTQRYHAHNKTTGYGHVYQGRYKSFPVQDDAHFHKVCRYVERNALTAKIVKQAEDYRWGSLWNWCGGDSVVKLSTWPVKRLPNWIQRVNQSMTSKETKALKNCINRGCPFGTETWVNQTANEQGLELTLRPRGRPRKLA